MNSTFYRLGSLDAVARWVEQAPPGFLFAAKASRYLTHVKRLTEPRVESGKLGPIVCSISGRAASSTWSGVECSTSTSMRPASRSRR